MSSITTDSTLIELETEIDRLSDRYDNSLIEGNADKAALYAHQIAGYRKAIQTVAKCQRETNRKAAAESDIWLQIREIKALQVLPDWVDAQLEDVYDEPVAVSLPMAVSIAPSLSGVGPGKCTFELNNRVLGYVADGIFVPGEKAAVRPEGRQYLIDVASKMVALLPTPQLQ